MSKLFLQIFLFLFSISTSTLLDNSEYKSEMFSELFPILLFRLCKIKILQYMAMALKQEVFAMLMT